MSAPQGSTAQPRVTVLEGGTTRGTRPKINIIAGTNVTTSISDDAGNDRVNITINSSGGGAPTSEFADNVFRIIDDVDNTKKAAFSVGGITTSTTRTFTLPNVDMTIAGRDNTETLTNKTLTAPVISTISNSGTLTLPTSTDTLVGRATTDTLTNKTLTAPIISTISNTGTLTLPTTTDTLVGRATADTLTNKTLTAPVISTISNTGTLTLPTATTTLVGRDTTDTLTNKTISSASNTITLTKTINIPIAMTSSPANGNCYPKQATLTAYYAPVLAFIDSAAGDSYGFCRVPANYTSTPKLIIDYAADTATANDVRWIVSTAPIADTESFNPASLTAETAVNSTVPGTAKVRKQVSITLTPTIAADDMIIVKIQRDAANAADTATGDAWLFGAAFQCVVTN